MKTLANDVWRRAFESNGDFLTLDLFRDYIRRGLDLFLITQHDNLMPDNLQHILDNATPAEKKHIVIRFVSELIVWVPLASN